MPAPLLALLAGVGGYFLGSIPTGYWVGRWWGGIDIRTQGSGSTGATNVL
ncbi:MAG: glycerol-3-phosphate acyltransferase, partial [Cyanobacteriota bacterium]